MGERQPGPQEGAAGAIEIHQPGRWRRQFPHQHGQQFRADPRRTEPPAFEIEIGNLVERIDQAEIAVEFEAVDDDRRRHKADVLGPEIAVAFDNGPVRDAPGKHGARGAQGQWHAPQDLVRPLAIEVELPA
jgi:hypothetical protein